mgnify:CR=1 FL=1
MKKNILIISLCFVLLIMGICYSLFSSKLNISGTSSITSNFDVEITSIEKTNVGGNVVEKSKSFTKDSANFSVEMEKPKDYVYYKIGVTNKGSLPAIATLGNLNCSNNSVFECGAYPDSSVSSSIKNNTDLSDDRLVIDVGETEYYNVYIKFSDNVSKMPSDLSGVLTLGLIYKQSDVGAIHKSENNCFTGKVLKDGTISIIDYDASCGSDVVIPSSIDGYSVTKIADGIWDDNKSIYIGSFSSKRLNKVIFPDTVTYIGSYSFASSSISEVIFGSSVKYIGYDAFRNNNISKVDFPESLETIDAHAFGKNKLTEVSLPNSLKNLGNAAFSSQNFPNDKTAILYDVKNGVLDKTTINSFMGTDATNFVIPSNVKKIGVNAFWTVNIESIEIPSTVEVLDVGSFATNNLSSVKLNEGLIEIGNSVFAYNNLTDIVIPDSVQSIGDNAFKHSLLKTVVIGSGVKVIGYGAFKSEGIYNPIVSFKIKQKKGSITGSPWGSSTDVEWIV